ncbi:hypothetical protein BOX15_Mlig003875g1, partial [Macrostomum lignano]
STKSYLSSAADIACLMSTKRVFLFDCDGVIWNENTLVPGAKDLLTRLKQLGRQVFLVTNNSSKSRAQYVAKCRKLELPIEEADIVCTAAVAAGYISKLKLPGVTYVIGSQGLQDELELHGIKCCGFREDDDTAVHDQGVEQFGDAPLRNDVSCVLLALDTRFNYLKLLKACSYVSAGALFLGSNEDAFLPSGQPSPTVPVRLPGTGAMLSALCVATQQQPAAVMGKPHRPMLDYAVQLMTEARPDQQPPPLSQWLMVGDRLDTDIAFGRRHGMDTVCVMTGCTKPADLLDLSEANSELKPNCAAESVADLLPHLAEN